MQDLPEDSSFIYVRSPAEGLPELNVTEFLAQHNSEIDDLKHDFFDHEPIVKNMLLATNITLFGGGNPEDGESSFYFWLHNKFISFPNFRVILSTLCEKYHISAYLETLINWLSSGPIPYAIEHWQSTSGCLLQIFIPKEKFDRCVYLSKPYGIPIDPHTRASHMLDQLCAHSFDSETQRSIFSEIDQTVV
jgi:hypothetical protein